MPTPPAVATDLVVVIDAELGDRIDATDLPDNLREAVRYSVLNGGKRLRAVLTLMSCTAVDGRQSDALPPAAAIEMIHSFSLVHDDLPAMDDDDMRRGRPSLHRHAGEAMAILAGDVMVSLAFQFLHESELAPEVQSALAGELATATSAMIAGQVYDTLGGFPANLDEAGRLELIHHRKTGALIRGACRLGGMAGGATREQLDSLSRYGESIGLMFQIVDDLLDVTQSAEHVGKATGKDESAGKLTYAGVHGVDASRREIERLRVSAREALESLGPAAQPLAELCEYMAVRTR